MPLTRPVDDVIALADPARRRMFWHADYAYETLLAFGVLNPAPKWTNRHVFSWADAPGDGVESQRVARWRSGPIPATFLRAARRAAGGHFSAELAPYFERIRFTPGDEPDEVPGFLELAAWCLDRVMREERFEVKPCALCGVPFLSSGRSRYCRRIAPGSSGQWCVRVGKVRDYQARQRAKKGDKRG